MTLSRAALFASLTIAVAAPRLAAQAHDDLNRLAWLAGCWEQRAGTRIVHEQWMSPLGGTMMGMSRTVVGEATREFEQLRIEIQGGKAAYVASPSRQATATFLATALSDSAVTFENPQHDFPTKILYRKLGADALVARIEGPQGGQVKGIDFPMRRVRCP